MSVNLRSTPEYYPGFQKVSMTAEPVFRLTVAVLVIKTLLLIILPRSIHGLDRSVFELLIKLGLVLPIIIRFAGGMSRKGIPWYIAMSFFSLLALIPSYSMDRYIFILFMIPALLCMYRVHRSSPWIMQQFGYTEKKSVAVELVWAILAAAVFISIYYYALSEVAGLEFNMYEPARYVSMTFLCMFDYGVLFGLMYGMFTKRMLQLGGYLPAIIGMNIFLFFLNVSPEVVGHETPMMAFSAAISSAVLTQLVLGLAYFHFRSTRMVFIAYLLNYLLYKSFI